MNMLRLVAPMRAADIELIHGNEGHDVHPSRIDGADLVVVCRDFPRLVVSFEDILQRARLAGKPLIYETDDLLQALPPEHPDHARGYYDDAAIPMLHAIVSADAVTTSTPLLRDTLRLLNPQCHLLENYLIDDFWFPASDIDGPSPVNSAASDPIELGYMGGNSHVPDLAMVENALHRVLNQYGERVRLRLIGLGATEKLRTLSNVEVVDLAPQLPDKTYAGFASWFHRQHFDVLLGPLRDNLFNRCKSAIKFLEYSSLAAATLFSRVGPYAAMVRSEETGLLASTVDDFEQSLVRLIEDAPLRARLGDNALRHARDTMRLSLHAHKWREAYEHILRRKSRVATRNRSCRRAELIDTIAVDGLAYLSRMRQRENAVTQELRSIHASKAWKLVKAIWRLIPG